MRYPRLCALLASFLLLLVIALGGGHALMVRAQPVPQAPKAADPNEEAEKAKAKAINVMTFPTDRDAKQMIEAVQQYLNEYQGKYDKAPWDKICFAAQQVLNANSDSFYEVEIKGDDSGKFHGISAKAETNRLIGQFPTEGKQFYQFAYGPEAQRRLTQAIEAGYDRVELADISLRYFHTKAGGQATLLLANYHLELGNFNEAAYSFERLLSHGDIEELFTPRLTFKAIVALKRGGSQQNATIAKLWEQLSRRYPREGVLIGRKYYSLDDLRREAERPFETLYGRVSELYATMRYGNSSHTAIAEGGTPFLDPTFSIPMNHRSSFFTNMEGSIWISQNLAEVLKNIKPESSEVAIPGFFPITSPNYILYRTYDGVFATVTRDGVPLGGRPVQAGALGWIAPTIGSLNSMMGGTDKTPQKWWESQYRQPNYSSILFDNPLVGSLTHDGQRVYFIDDLALPQPNQQNANDFGMPIPAMSVSTGSFKGLSDGSHLKAVDLETGSLKWILGETIPNAPALTDEQEDLETNPLILMQNSFFLGPPLPLNGKLYVLFERNGKIRLACLDPSRMLKMEVTVTKVSTRSGLAQPEGKPETSTITFPYPELLWTQRLGEPNQRLPNDTIRRFQCSYLAYADGVMICPTNAGAVVAVDVMSRSLLWAQSYRFLKPEANPQERRIGRVAINAQMNAGQSQLNQERWRAAAPIISRGRVVFAAFDSDVLNCLDLRTGQILWSEPRRKGDLYVGGIVDDRIIVVGKESVRAIELMGEPNPDAGENGPKETVKYAWSDVRIGLPAGHGTTSKGSLYYLPIAVSPETGQPEVWAIDVAKGQVVTKAAYRRKETPGEPRPMLGNLVFHEGQLICQTPTEVVAFPLLEAKEQEMNRLLAANPRDPVGLLTRGELLLDRGKWIEAVADFKEAEKNNPPESIQLKLRDKLYAAYTELLRQDFSSNEYLLKEYERLCELPIISDDPSTRQKMADEQFRRKTLYLTLIAKGREEQGRLLEAFDHYREFAALGAGKQLVSIYDEPNGQIRPDVWAQGRISAMIRNAESDELRKPLEQRVQKEWESVRQGNDLNQLREFCRVFGPYFDSGREGQLQLARKLMETLNENDAREAQSILLDVSATADSQYIQAQALEMLARLMTKNGFLDDAVGLYSRLGNRYAKVPVRDGKTGTDYLSDLLTDKRLLPYLEPTRIPTPPRISVDQVQGATAGAQPSGFTFIPDGDLLPFFQRYRLSLSNNESNDGTWVLRVTDRTTGAEWHKFRGLRVVAPNGVPQYRIGTASGHILLLHLGHIAYCFDLAEKKELWQYNLLGERSRIDQNNIQYETGPDGETTISYMADGFKIRFGRSSVLEANYACLLTRDGLVALDPATGNKLWTRTDVSLSSQMFGDPQHIFLVESEKGAKPTSRVLRAIDGAPVENSAEFGDLFASAKRVRVFGRLLLLNEESGNTPGFWPFTAKRRVLRLYDPLKGKDIWKQSFAAESQFINSLAPEFVGVLEKNGKFQVLEALTGEIKFQGQVDAKNLDAHVKPATEPYLLHDSERFYLVLNSNKARRGATYYYGYMPLRVTTINGPIYAFERASGKRLWYTEKLFEGQSLITERFAETPALISATQTVEEGTNIAQYRVIVVDKQNGKIRYLQGLQQNGVFFALTQDPSDGSTRLVRGDLSIRIQPDHGASNAGQPTTR